VVGSVAFAQREDTYNRARVVVRFTEGNEPGNPAGDGLVEYMRARRYERVAYIERVYAFDVGRELGEERREVAARWPGVEFAEFDFIGHVASLPPTDANWCEQWAFENRGQTVNGTSGTATKDICAIKGWSARTDASSVTIAILDTGVNWQHPDLIDNMWVNPGEIAGNGIDDDNNGYVDDVNGVGVEDDLYDPSFCFDSGNIHPFPEGNPQDIRPACEAFCNYNVPAVDHGYHGTPIAAVIGAKGDNGNQVAGTAWRASMMAIRMISCDVTFNLSSAAKAFQYASANGAKIASCSWEPIFEYSASLELVFKQVRDDGIIVVLCAGNTNTNLDASPPPSFRYPHAFTFANIVVVMGTDQSGSKWGPSSYGATSVDIAAPSINIRTLDNQLVTPAQPVYEGGTSFAAPMVAAACGLVWAEHPTWTYSQVISKILNSGTYDSGLSTYCATGRRLNLAAALGATCPSCRPPVTNCYGSCP